MPHFYQPREAYPTHTPQASFTQSQAHLQVLRFLALALDKARQGMRRYYVQREAPVEPFAKTT